MKNKLSILFTSAAVMLCSVGAFTSCVNGVDDEYLELVNSGQAGGDKPGDEETPLPDLNGDYVEGGDLQLTLTYNGEPLAGKTVNVAADETNEMAIITLAGLEADLSELVGGLLEFKVDTFSPVPGVQEIILSDVPLYVKGETYLFKGEFTDPAYTLAYDGKIEDGKMKLDLIHQLTDNRLAGTWDLAPKSITHGNSAWLYSPLWMDWDSRVQVNLGRVSIANVKGEMNGIFAILTGAISPMIMRPILGVNMNTMDIIRNLLKGVVGKKDGGMYAIYSYSGDMTAPAWSDNMSHNMIRYYFDPASPENRLYIEVTPQTVIGLIGGLLNPEVTRAADPGVTQELGRQLIGLLTPILQKGIPCDYSIEGDNLSVNIDGVVLRDLLAKIFELANDELAAPVVEEFLWANVGDFAPNLMNLIRLVPYTLKYHSATTYDPTTNVPLDPTGECGYVKLGLKFVRVKPF